MMAGCSLVVFLCALADVVFMVYAAITGFPPTVAGHALHLKNLRTPFVLLVILVLAALALNPRRQKMMVSWKDKLESLASKPAGLWLLFGVYGFLFLWQQLTEYYALEINFLPFSYYDYMLYYLFQGKINFTGLLHTYYHTNNILLLFAPFWYWLRSPLVLEVPYGFLASAAIFPLYGLAREKRIDPLPALILAFVYLNYRYLQNVLLMNFSVEIFYPLFIFSTVYFALKSRWGLYYLFLLLGLSVKEDSFLYFPAVGLLVFCMRGKKLHGILTGILSLLYFVWLVKFFIPATGNTILKGSVENFQKYGNSMTDILFGLIKNPLALLSVFFGSPEKLKTYLNLLSRLAFIPLFSPVVFLILAPIFPLFLHSTGHDTDFINLRFHYAATVLPFVFLALVYGFSNIVNYPKLARWKTAVTWALCLILVLLNGGNYTTQKITRDKLESIAWAKSVPAGANLVTLGHLLPYVGYRRYNYYIATPFEWPEHYAHGPYANPDYYLIDLTVHPYPMDQGFIEGKVAQVSSDPRYQLIREEPHKRYLFKRRTEGESSTKESRTL